MVTRTFMCCVSWNGWNLGPSGGPFIRTCELKVSQDPPWGHQKKWSGKNASPQGWPLHPRGSRIPWVTLGGVCTMRTQNGGAPPSESAARTQRLRDNNTTSKITRQTNARRKEVLPWQMKHQWSKTTHEGKRQQQVCKTRIETSNPYKGNTPSNQRKHTTTEYEYENPTCDNNKTCETQIRTYDKSKESLC